VDREELARRIDARVDRMIATGAAEEAREAREAGASRTARAALGFEQLLGEIDAAPSAETVDAIKSAHRSYARRQLTWMRRMEGVTLIDRSGRDDEEVAAEVVAALG
jgi:tRNA dimethylallyltransferase